MTIPLLALLALASPDGPPDDGLEPVTVAVVDGETGGPVTSLRYQMYYEAPGQPIPYDRSWTLVESPSGTFTVRAEVVQAPPHREGARLPRRPGDVSQVPDPRGGQSPPRRPEAHARDHGPGDHPRCRDPGPDRGAKVQPISPTGLNMASLDDEWAVETDREGRYELHGVDPEGASRPRIRTTGERRTRIAEGPSGRRTTSSCRRAKS